MTAKVELLTPSGGKVILDPSDTAVDRTLTLPAVAGTVLNTASDIEAQVKTATSATGSAPIFSCRAWVNFDGTTTPPTIRASGNVSSITDQGSGRYDVNLTTAMPDTDYTVIGNVGHTLGGAAIAGLFNADLARTKTTAIAPIGIVLGSNGNTYTDYDQINVAIFR